MTPDKESGNSSPSVAIVVLNWMGWRDTIECLESLFCLDYPNFQVVLCDNASTDGSVDRIKAWARGELVPPVPENPALRALTAATVPKPIAYTELDRATAELPRQEACGSPLVIINTGANLGYAGGNNVGLRYGIGTGLFKYFWILNNDIVVDSRALHKLISSMEEHRSAGACGSLSLYYNDPKRIECFGGGKFNKYIGVPHRFESNKLLKDTKLKESGLYSDLDYISGASMLVSSKFIRDIGLMCEDYFLYYEELDWFTRAKGKFFLCVCKESIVYHKHGSTIGSSDKSQHRSLVSEYFLKKSRLKFIKKFHPGVIFTSYMILFSTMIVRLVIGPRISSKIIFHVLMEDMFNIKPLIKAGSSR